MLTVLVTTPDKSVTKYTRALPPRCKPEEGMRQLLEALAPFYLGR
jgi:hypothetical protein